MGDTIIMTETDRELLMFAAKSAGIEIFFDSEGDCYRVKESGNRHYWNPLAFDGDALRLAVKSNMTLAVGIARSDAGEFTEFDMCDTDPYAATRRAIVRAAAEIGRNMK